MSRKLAVLIRDRQAEALRMAVGLTLADDRVDVFVMDRPVEETEQNRLNIDSMELMDMQYFTNSKDNAEAQMLSREEIARKILEYDHIIAY